MLRIETEGEFSMVSLSFKTKIKKQFVWHFANTKGAIETNPTQSSMFDTLEEYFKINNLQI